MVSKQFSFRLPDEAVAVLEALQIEGETLNQTAQRRMIECLGLSTDTSRKLSTPVDMKSLVKQEVEASLAEVRSQLEAQLEELRGKLKAR
ncbi:hypothetical protein NIES4072_62000 [Nostoc commune NIES-4072]|uniref:Arc-like DNA binding domain-containing protein n=1 Tax=Nostoc commune NIES-4072 TaxID=2005467 RepID=A0A2R5FWP6_NOSCO|nr:hypothetical protein [Nostoc commune]BBD66530.1 hypothetical protein NIES4070_28960 [Nostoc commune HK-02]GBG22489.1 hypothetical protein NIES4072_62000 [Nostoc commune NIES-4072]